MLKQYNKKNERQCIELFLDIFNNEPYLFTWLDEQGMSRYFDDLYNTPKFLGFIYTEETEIVGFCLGVYNDYFGSIIYDIKEIAVKRSLQGQGIGSKMLVQIEKELKGLGISSITLLTQRTIDAYNFYLKNNYAKSDTTVFMSKGLD